MALVSKHDLELLNELTVAGDNSRRNLTSTLLTLYGAVTSGLFLLVSTSGRTIIGLDFREKVLLIAVAFSAILIVFLALIEKIEMI